MRTTTRLWIDHDCDVVWEDMRDDLTGEWLVDAEVEVEIVDSNDQVVGTTFNLVRDLGTHANYHGTIDNRTTALLVVGETYYIKITATRGSAIGFRRLSRLAAYRDQRSFPPQPPLNPVGGTVRLPSRLNIDSDCDVIWQNMQDPESGNWLMDATITVGLYDANDVLIGQTTSAEPVPSQTATYVATIDNRVTTLLTEGDDYWVVIEATSGTLTGYRKIKRRASLKGDRPFE